MPAVYEPLVIPADFRGHYPHMAKRDTAVWDRFLSLKASQFLGFVYDLALGGVRIEGTEFDEGTILGWQYSTALKIDAVGLTDEQAWIIEVRPDATVSALGAALAYTLVAEREQVFVQTLVPVIVCETIHPDVAWAAEQLAVHVERA